MVTHFSLCMSLTGYNGTHALTAQLNVMIVILATYYTLLCRMSQVDHLGVSLGILVLKVCIQWWVYHLVGNFCRYIYFCKIDQILLFTTSCSSGFRSQ